MIKISITQSSKNQVNFLKGKFDSINSNVGSSIYNADIIEK